jgi:hypothetical protein
MIRGSSYAYEKFQEICIERCVASLTTSDERVMGEEGRGIVRDMQRKGEKGRGKGTGKSLGMGAGG